MDLELIAAAQSGNRYALSVVLQENYEFVFKYLIKLTLDTQEAQDLTQDVMVQAIQKFYLFDPQKSSLSTWLIVIGKNLWIDRLRRQKRRGGFHLDLDTCLELPPDEDPYSKFLESDALVTALKTLSDKMRTPIILQYAFGYTYEEIAKCLKIPMGTVKSRIANGIKALRKELDEDGRKTS